MCLESDSKQFLIILPGLSLCSLWSAAQLINKHAQIQDIIGHYVRAAAHRRPAHSNRGALGTRCMQLPSMQT